MSGWFVKDQSGAMYPLGNSLKPTKMNPDPQITAERAVRDNNMYFYGDALPIPEFFELTGSIIGDSESDLRQIMDSLPQILKLSTNLVREENSGNAWEYSVDASSPLRGWVTWSPQMNGIIADVTIKFALKSWARTSVQAMPIRKAKVYSTNVINPNSVAVGKAPLANAFRIYRVSTSVPARVRLYATTAQRDGDLDRQPGVDPQPNAGVILDVLTFANGLSHILVPPAFGFSAEDVLDGTIPISVQNRTTAATAVGVSFEYVEAE